MVDIYGGNTNSVLTDKDLLDVFVPILRSDFRLSETYEYVPHSSKIMCDITIMNGTEDFSIQTKDITMWKAFAGKKCSFEYINGNHFFITENVEDTVAAIKKYV
jgi:surfactin synthase thioesterase subunit